MIRLLLFIDWLLGFYVFILLFAAIMSWLLAFDVVNYKNNVVRMVMQVLTALTEPVLAPMRRYLPSVGGLDISFLVLFILIQFIRSVILPGIGDLFQ
jgi:YggT family protein